MYSPQPINSDDWPTSLAQDPLTRSQLMAGNYHLISQATGRSMIRGTELFVDIMLNAVGGGELPGVPGIFRTVPAFTAMEKQKEFKFNLAVQKAAGSLKRAQIKSDPDTPPKKQQRLDKLARDQADKTGWIIGKTRTIPWSFKLDGIAPLCAADSRQGKVCTNKLCQYSHVHFDDLTTANQKKVLAHVHSNKDELELDIKTIKSLNSAGQLISK